MTYQLVLVEGKVARKEVKVNSYTGERITLTPNSKLENGFALVKEVNRYRNMTYYDGYNIKAMDLLNDEHLVEMGLHHAPLTRFVYRSREATPFCLFIVRDLRLIPVIVDGNEELANAYTTVQISKGKKLAFFETRNLFSNFLETEMYLGYNDIRRIKLGFGFPERRTVRFDYSSHAISRQEKELVAHG